MRLAAQEIHARIHWPSVLVSLGIPETALRNRHGPCPACGGKDCFRFDHDKRGKGSFICSKATGKGGGALSGDGFALLMHVHGWAFSEARQRVIAAAGLTDATYVPIGAPAQPREAKEIARPTGRVQRIRRGACAVADCEPVVDYLASRGLWPLPAGCMLRAHAGVDYFDDEAKHVGSYPALLADLVDLTGELVSLHVTYVPGGRKLGTHEPRKQLGKTMGHEGCAVRLWPAGEILGVSEGIETAVSAAILDGIPVWPTLNAALLAKFEPPPHVQTLRIYADRDVAGLTAAVRLMERLQGRVHIEPRLPAGTAKDFNDQLAAQSRKASELGEKIQ